LGQMLCDRVVKIVDKTDRTPACVYVLSYASSFSKMSTVGKDK
jgi:hypothetical protein